MAIDRKKIIDDLSQIEIQGSETGIIDAFGVYVNQLPTTLWNTFAERLIAKTEPDMVPSIEMLLVNAAQECGYHTGYGIISSEEWKAVVQPMVENTEDVLHGAFAVLTAFGWAHCEIVELEASNKMVVRSYNYYEADIVKFGAKERKCAFMIQGICAAFMALAYSGDYTTDSSKLYDYSCTQVKGIECGDDYGEFVVEKA